MFVRSMILVYDEFLFERGEFTSCSW